MAADDLAARPTSAAVSCTRATAARYYLATRLLPAWKRRHVHALYGFTRYADEIVDRSDGRRTRRARGRGCAAWSDALGRPAPAARSTTRCCRRCCTPSRSSTSTWPTSRCSCAAWRWT